jgi:hypothetical protein
MTRHSMLMKVVRSIKDRGMLESAIKISGSPIVRHPFASAFARKKLRYILKPPAAEMA